MIVDIECEDGTTQIARTVLENQDNYVVQFLERNKQNFFNFVDGTEEVPKTSLSGFYDVEELEDTKLFTRYPQGYDLIDDSDDETFECSETDEEDSEDESLVDEDET
jgi:hypothetical protein|tara:strand:- start:3499 stop:3819 length:321 start_codon:yes stop_codon:yes gene_type:complete